MAAQVIGVYAIINTVSKKSYIGCSVNIRVRLARHRLDLRKGIHRNCHLQRSWDKHGPNAFEYKTLEEVSQISALVNREQWWIDHFNAPGMPGTFNLVMQAEHRTHSDETRQKMSQSHRGKKFTEEHRANLVLSMKGRRGKPLTPERRAQISAQMKGRKQSPESIAKRIASMKGKPRKPVSDTTRKKMSDSAKGKPKTAEHRANIGAAKKGIPLSTERREKLAEIQRNRTACTRAKLAEANSKFTREQVLAIRARATNGERVSVLAADLAVSHSVISDIVRRRTWRHV